MADARTLFQNRIIGYDTKPADQFLFNPLNYRKHPQRQRDAVNGSLKKLGWIAAVVENVRTGNLVDGHERVWQALQNNEDVPYLQVDLSEEEERLALAIFDPLTNMAETDAEILDELLREVNTGDATLQGLLAELATGAGLYLNGKAPVIDPGPQISRADELQEKWQVQPGDLWQLGEHRLICGDCADAAVVERLMRGEKADVCPTDPPFNVRSDEWDKFDDFLGFTRVWLRNAKSCSVTIAAFFADKFLPLLAKAAELEGIPFRRSLIWVKPPGSQFAGGQMDGYWYDFELIQVYGGIAIEPSNSPKFSVFDYRTVTGQEHGAQKNPDLYGDIIKGYSGEGGVVFEPFSGTGSNLVACEQLGRKCRAAEIHPPYCSVTLQRYFDMTGVEPVRIG